MKHAAHQDIDEMPGHRAVIAVRGAARRGATRGRGYAFQLAIQSRSFAPAGFIACLVDTTSMGVIVAKS